VIADANAPPEAADHHDEFDRDLSQNAFAG
jgi:hypothetical protein